MSNPSSVRIANPGLLLILCLAFVSCISDDSKIAGDINEKLMSASPTVRATVRDGVVTLTGTCPDQSCKNVSETAAKNTEGVERVINEIVVKQAAPPRTTISDSSVSASQER